MPLPRDFFLPFYLKSLDLDEMASMAVFEVVKFASIVKIILGLFLGNQGIILHKDWAYLENGLLYGLSDFTIMFLVKFY